MKNEKEELNVLRGEIDQADIAIQKLIVKRASCAQRIAQIKQNTQKIPVYYRPEREAQVLKNVMQRPCDPLPQEEMARLFREVMSVCLAIEEPIKVAYLGPEGTFTQQAALKHFGQAAVAQPMHAIDEVFREVESGAVDYGVVPVENSTEGVVTHTLDSFIQSSLSICGEVVLRIHHHLLSAANTRCNAITRLYSHPQSLAQCRKWLDANWPHLERVEVGSNGEAAKRVKEEWNSVAIAGEMACKIYGLEKISENIEDLPNNSTRFLVIGRNHIPPSQDDKTSLIASIRNRSGGLYELLEPFYRAQIDLTRIESRPARTGIWNYIFFIDLKGHIADSKVCAVIEQLKEKTVDVKILGSYPVGVL